ncbi:hypothetical protein TVAG_417030 [Trichomonas vaginalis G3]|uniref:RRM domain-containing protein n=1 Tax=Trichomonas vaginalis (strain ATCC PRA-98 / G3) TaxID=412133 RepID=A2ESG1_TRIV3|nr:RNA-binding protein family [Trichomonas vaginalis G3]EAY04405.1 hypothetical protein TVAG_417030 [Trichomonas vaginalis G3]KAI5526338.1 RNA-binding protein family [Trichomonas vaginalis G3]|eukprot:XP_001316628.1 hypothetical protein [Trichomonas vaginalis G3]
MQEKELNIRKIPRLKGGWNVSPEEYKAMGYTPGLPPGLVAPTSKSIREISSLFEICGTKNQYIQSNEEKLYMENTIFVENRPEDADPLQTVQFIVKQLMKQGSYSSPGTIPDFYSYQNQVRVVIIFPSKTDAETVMKLDQQLVFNGTKLHFTRPEDYHQIPRANPSFLFAEHPQRVIIVNVDTSQLHQLPEFLQHFFDFDAIYPVDNMNDCVLVDVRPPMSPEVASSRINGKQFGDYVLSCSAMRSVYDQEIPDYPGLFNIPCEGLSLQQILQPKTRITCGAETSEKCGKFLYIMNCVPFEVIDNRNLNVMVSYDIANELGKYGKVVKCTLSKDPNIGSIRNFGVAVVEFETEEDALEAQISVAGMKYMGRTVITMLSE